MIFYAFERFLRTIQLSCGLLLSLLVYLEYLCSWYISLDRILHNVLIYLKIPALQVIGTTQFPHVVSWSVCNAIWRDFLLIWLICRVPSSATSCASSAPVDRDSSRQPLYVPPEPPFSANGTHNAIVFFFITK